MEIPVLLEPLPDGGFRARSGDPSELTAQAFADSASPARDLIETRVASGTLLTTIEVLDFRAGRHPGAGIYREEPLFDQWRAAIDAYRTEIEEDPEIP